MRPVQDTLVDAVENAEVAEIKRAVFRALTRLRAATIKDPDAQQRPSSGADICTPTVYRSGRGRDIYRFRLHELATQSNNEQTFITP